MTEPITMKDIIGSWRLDSAVQVFQDGERIDEFGSAADGYLCYTAQGTVTAVLGSTARAALDAADPQAATPAEYAIAARQFIAYAGRFTIDSDHGDVTHHIDVSLFPNRQGQGQHRHLVLDGDRLTIVAADRTAGDGRRFHVELHWRRPSG